MYPSFWMKLKLLETVCFQSQSEKTRIQRSSPPPQGDAYSSTGTHRFSDKVFEMFTTSCLHNSTNFHSSFISTSHLSCLPSSPVHNGPLAS